MGRFSDIDMQLIHGHKPTKTPDIGSFGVCLNDPNNPPRFFKLLQIIGGLGLFSPVDQPGDIVQFDIVDFWALT
jgi:hypothetical protein